MKPLSETEMPDEKKWRRGVWCIRGSDGESMSSNKYCEQHESKISSARGGPAAPVPQLEPVSTSTIPLNASARLVSREVSGFASMPADGAVTVLDGALRAPSPLLEDRRVASKAPGSKCSTSKGQEVRLGDQAASSLMVA